MSSIGTHIRKPSRTDISLGMEMGGRLGLAQPTAADYFYRMVPVMETLAKVQPEDLENRLRLGMAYRWNNDQLTAIATHEALLKDLHPHQKALRARALIELAWSRIAKVAWNRTFDDPGILQAYNEAAEAYDLTDRPLDKFTAAYTMAYSHAFMPKRDNRAMLQRLTEAHEWYLQLRWRIAGVLALSARQRYLERRHQCRPGLQAVTCRLVNAPSTSNDPSQPAIRPDERASPPLHR